MADAYTRKLPGMTRRGGGPSDRHDPVTNEQLRVMTPDAIARGMEDGTLRLPTIPDVDHVCSRSAPGRRSLTTVYHGLSFRQRKPYIRSCSRTTHVGAWTSSPGFWTSGWEPSNVALSGVEHG